MSHMSGDLPYCYRRPAWRLAMLLLLLLRLVRLQIGDIFKRDYIKNKICNVQKLCELQQSQLLLLFFFIEFHSLSQRCFAYINPKIFRNYFENSFGFRVFRPVAGRTETRRGTKRRRQQPSAKRCLQRQRRCQRCCSRRC